MTNSIERPAILRINAWSGDRKIEDPLPSATPWAQREQGRSPGQWLSPAAPSDLRDWRHPDVGWGLVLPDRDDLTMDDRVNGGDAPEPIQKLLRSRPGSPVLRWSTTLQQNYLRRYYPDGRSQDLSISAPKPGTSDGRIPRYLLIYASPTEIPWAVQYALNLSTYVGRIDLKGDGLERYIDALITDWKDFRSQPLAPLVWRVDHGRDDITWLMARAVAGKLWALLENDGDLKERFLLGGPDATCANFADALAERVPGLIVTTSHGMTGPLGDPDALRAQLGAPVDVMRRVLRMGDLSAWHPGGAIWYAHACCSAGSDAVSRYATLLPRESAISLTITGVAEAAGAMVARLPCDLLGGESPLRAFIGHVEPTFDWTLRDPVTQEVHALTICSALYNELYQADRRTPVGYALRGIFAEAGAFYGAWQDAIAGINQNLPKMRDWALYRQLVAADRQTLVIIGDPTVSLALPTRAAPSE